MAQCRISDGGIISSKRFFVDFSANLADKIAKQDKSPANEMKLAKVLPLFKTDDPMKFNSY